MPEDVAQQVIQIVAGKSNMLLDQIEQESSLNDDLGINSLDLVKLIFTLEDEFNIDFFSDEEDEIQTVRDLIDATARKIFEKEE